MTTGTKEKYDRVDFLSTYGIVPYSVWDLRDSVKFNNEIYKKLGERTGKSTREGTAKYFGSAGEKTVFTGTTSYFSPYLAKVIYQSYSQKGDLVFDPFASTVRPYMAVQTERRYIGCEVRQDEVDKINKILAPFSFLFGDNVKVIHKDCRLFESEEMFDLVFTCPPYWNHETYSDLLDDMSNINDYDLFLSEMVKVGKVCNRVLKEDKFCVIVAGDFRDYSEGRKNIERLVPFTSDLIKTFEIAGFYLYDKVVVIKRLGTAPSRTKMWNNRKTVRIHEDVLIFKNFAC